MFGPGFCWQSLDLKIKQNEMLHKTMVVETRIVYERPIIIRAVRIVINRLSEKLNPSEYVNVQRCQKLFPINKD